MRVMSGNVPLVATGDGVLQAIPLCPTCLTNHALAAVATARLERAKALSINPLTASVWRPASASHNKS